MPRPGYNGGMNKILTTVLVLLALAAPGGVRGAVPAPELAPRFHSWLDMVEAIAGKEE